MLKVQDWVRTVLATRGTRRSVAVNIALARSSHPMGPLTRTRARQPTTPVRLSLSDPARTLRGYRCFGAETVGVRGSKSRKSKGHRQLPSQSQSSRARVGTDAGECAHPCQPHLSETIRSAERCQTESDLGSSTRSHRTVVDSPTTSSQGTRQLAKLSGTS
ncbi:hypothetical protein L1887_57188 [Cichorium endivia]|nr:hypothetical protein L1887_57188 [Cichorium endivia]